MPDGILAEAVDPSHSRRRISHYVIATHARWQRNQKWKNNKDDGSEPKWRTNQKWKNRNDSSDDTSDDTSSDAE